MWSLDMDVARGSQLPSAQAWPAGVPYAQGFLPIEDGGRGDPLIETLQKNVRL